MKFVVTLVLLVAVCQAAEQNELSRSRQNKDSSKTDKRALEEGNAGIKKREPVIPTALPSAVPGIVYADTNQIEAKSPTQQVSVTPLPQLAKISDLFTGQGHHFQSAINSHLFSPVSIYQTRIPGYDVSAPVPAKLAYTEKITYQPQISQQYTPQVFKQPQKQANFIRVSYPQPVDQYQQLIPQQLQQVNQYQQLQSPQIQQVNQQHLNVPQIQPVNQYQQLQAPQIQTVPQYQQQQQPQFIQIQPYQPSSPLVYNQNPFQYQGPAQFTPQPLQYIQQQLPANVQTGIVYAREGNQKPVQRELKTVQPQQNVQEKPEQTYNTQSQGAVSYASFSVGPAALQPQQHNQIQHQHQPIQYQLQPQIQYQGQQYQLLNQQAQAQQKQQQVQTQHQYQIQRQPLPRFTQQVQQIQYQAQQPQQQIHQQIQQQVIQKSEPSPANSVNVPSKAVALSSGKEQLAYYRPDPLYQPQVYQGQELLNQNQLAAQPILPVPTYPPVQFFGKFAHELFRSYQQQ